jgi:hypothetical protein
MWDARNYIDFVRIGGETLKVYTVHSKNSLLGQNQVVEEALREFFERHCVDRGIAK